MYLFEKMLLLTKRVHPMIKSKTKPKLRFQQFRTLNTPNTAIKPELPDRSFKLDLKGRIYLRNVHAVISPPIPSKPSSSDFPVVFYCTG